MSGRYVLGAGISGLLWAMYHPEYAVVSDQLGRVVTGAEPLVWLNDTPYTRRLVRDLGMPLVPVLKPIGYNRFGFPVGYDEVKDDDLDAVLLKKMVPWEVIQLARFAGAKVSVNTPSRKMTKNSGGIAYLDVDMQSLCAKVVDRVQGQLVLDRVREIRYVSNAPVMEGEENRYSVGHGRLVSTVPAPIFYRLLKGDHPRPYLHHVPVTYVISLVRPAWWDDTFAMVYDCQPDSPVSRVARFGNTYRYEFTGRPDDDELNEFMPVQGGRFVNPYGRIVQDVHLPALPGITFLGRAAEWDYRGLIDSSLERIHGVR